VSVVNPTLVRALLRRTWQQQGLALLFTPILFFLLLAALAAVVHFLPSLVTGPSRTALSASSRAQFGLSPSDGGALTLTFILVQAPYLLGLFAADAASRNMQGLFKSELDRGGFELLLSMPYTPREVLGSLLGAALVLTIGCWSVIAFSGYGLIGAVALTFGAVGFDLLAFLGMAFVVSLSCAIWAALATLLFSLWLPRAMSLSTNVGNGLTRFAAIGPALLMFIGINLMPAAHLPLFALWTLLLGAGATLGLLGIIAKLMRTDLFLSST
jgi:ABC-type transport system involved in multi-copper enzyme maturation permease subunit